MCQKQCRDENGFKCHRMSEGHQKQMMVFIENPSQFMDEFSKDFEESSPNGCQGSLKSGWSGALGSSSLEHSSN